MREAEKARKKRSSACILTTILCSLDQLLLASPLLLHRLPLLLCSSSLFFLSCLASCVCVCCRCRCTLPLLLAPRFDSIPFHSVSDCPCPCLCLCVRHSLCLPFFRVSRRSSLDRPSLSLPPFARQLPLPSSILHSLLTPYSLMHRSYSII